jgi:hypothetical protein
MPKHSAYPFQQSKSNLGTVKKAAASSPSIVEKWAGMLGRADKQLRARAFARRATPVPWPRQEELALIEYIITLGPSWSAILRQDRQTAKRLNCCRTQVGLKDKARTIKYRLLLAGMPLPPNFDCVTLGAALEAKLASLSNR